MRIDTAFNHRNRFLGHVREVYAFARISGLSHKVILDTLQARVYDDPAWKKVPGWVQARVTTEGGLLLERLYKPDLHGSDIYSPTFDPDKVAYLRWMFPAPDGEGYVDKWYPECPVDAGERRWNHKRENIF